MPRYAPRAALATHEVANQPPDFAGRDLWQTDPALREAALRDYAPAAVADPFCATRVGGDWGRSFGTLAAGTDFDGIVARVSSGVP
jgi:hypothetical protein